MADKGTTIWVTKTEHALLAESRELFQRFTGIKISWGAYLCALSLGALAAKALTGILIRCPNCEAEVAMTLVNPKLKRFREKELTAPPPPPRRSRPPRA
jgi:hypothetical protein